MSSAIQLEVRFADAQESRFQAAKRSNMSSANLQQDRFVDVQESRFQCAKRSNMCLCSPVIWLIW